MDAGGPTWKELLDFSASELGYSDIALNDVRFRKALASQEYARCFGRLEQLTERKQLEQAIRKRLAEMKEPGHLHTCLANLPFRGYITTNYDLLLEDALLRAGHHGWVPVGNTDSEIRKLSGQPSNIVWHAHGFLPSRADDDGKSNLIVTEEDYDGLYLEDSRAIAQLRGLLSFSRVVFFGFGFTDPEFERVLKLLGRLTSPTRPLFAFFPFLPREFSQDTREEYLLRYNVDLIPYEVRNGSHKRLRSLVDTYASFCVKRSMSFGRTRTRAPSFDPETTGLMVYNELCLRSQVHPTGNIRDALLRARVLSMLRKGESRNLTDLVEELHPRLNLLGKTKVAVKDTQETLSDILQQLCNDSLIEIAEGEAEQLITLTEEADKIVEDQRASAELLRDQFMASVHSRACGIWGSDTTDAELISEAATEFLSKCVQERALGVALALGNRGTAQAFHMVALLQNLPEFMEILSSVEQAIALSKLVQQILTNPSTAERNYIGVALQAQFAIHILGYDPHTLSARTEQLSRGVFIIDSSTLIPFLARSCLGHEASKSLIAQLQSLGATLATTPLLTTEVAEHARYALQKVDKISGAPTDSTYRACGGWSGARSNAFLEGFVREISDGDCDPNLYAYLKKSCLLKLAGKRCPDDCVESSLSNSGIMCKSLKSWDGFDQLLWGEVEEHRLHIESRRRDLGTYRHDRQTSAEAEVLVLVQGLRTGNLRSGPESTPHAFFISRSRVIDNVVDAATPITINPEALVQWASTLSACGVEELALLTDRLLWELSENNIKIVDVQLLQRVFGPMIDASKEGLAEVKLKHADLIAERYGEDSERAFVTISEHEYPIVAAAFYKQVADDLEGKLKEEQLRFQQAARQASLTSGEKQELETLKAEKRERKRKANHKRRSIQNKKKR